MTDLWSHWAINTSILRYDTAELLSLNTSCKWNVSGQSIIPDDIRKKTKRGKKAGTRMKMRRRKSKPFMPAVTFGNCQSLQQKIDELRANTRFLYQYREACCIALTETWLKDSIPDSAMQIPNFTIIRSDRTQADSNKIKGGGLALYVNDSWCNNMSIKHQHCSPDVEVLCVNLRPIYLPREFTNIFISLVYIPPNGNKEIAAEYVRNTENNLANEKPDSLQIILGDINRTNLKLPNYTQYVTCATRKDQILDHFYCNVKDAYRSVKGTPLKNSDHNMVYMQPTYVRKLKKQKPIEISKMQCSPDSLDVLNASFDLTDWDVFIDTSKDADELTDVITEYINFNIDMIIPQKEIKQFPNNKPWISSTLRKLIIDKHSSYSNDAPDYKDKQKEVNDAILCAKLDYKDKVEAMFKGNKMKEAWKGLKVLTGQEKSSKECALLNEGAADRLNSFYARFDNHDFSNEHSNITHRLLNLAKDQEPIVILDEEVISVFNKINVRKACGPDKISSLILKKCLSSLLYIVHKMYQISASVYKMPQIWKIGEIIPVSKKPLPKVDNDLRPITLTAILAKCFERVMLPKIKFHIKPILDNLQFAYLDNRSTEDAINTLIHCVTQHLDKSKTYVRLLFIDYSSAFNTMQPHILLKRLEEYQVPPNLQLWILDFLTNRKQYVRTSKETSSIIINNTGGPQGCVLSAFLFIIYTNPMALNNAQCKIIKYADDTVVIGLIENDDETAYRAAVEYVTDWCSENFLELNVTKTKEIIIDFRKSKNTKSPLVINGKSVEVATDYKYLGCTIQEDLKWDNHISNQIKKANKRMYHVRCLSKLHVDTKIISLFYNAVVSSVLVYAIACWYKGCTDKEKKDVGRFRRKVCKIICPDYHSSVDDPSSIHEKKCLSLVSRIINDQSHPLSCYFNMLPHGKRLCMIYCRTERFHNTFIPTAIKLFNSNHVIFN